MNLAKYLFWRGRNADPDEARDLSEPEDQDSDGMGSRMAKVAIHLVVCTVFASCCPVILLVAWLYFALGRYTYGFLVIFAETKKTGHGRCLLGQESAPSLSRRFDLHPLDGGSSESH